MKFYLSFRKSALTILLILVISTALAGVDQSELLKPGDMSPICNLEATDGNRYAFPASGSWSMVFYWSLFCHSCLEEIPAVQSHLASMGENVKPFFISLDSKRMEKGLKNFVIKRKLANPILMEEIASDSYVTADKWGVEMTPTVFIVAPDGKIAYSHAGPMDIEKFFNEFSQMQHSDKFSD